jgi:hypothetical protein
VTVYLRALGKSRYNESKGAETKGNNDQNKEDGDQPLKTALLGPRPSCGVLVEYVAHVSLPSPARSILTKPQTLSVIAIDSACSEEVSMKPYALPPSMKMKTSR